MTPCLIHVFSLYESNKLTFIEWDKLTSKEHEASTTAKRETVLSIDASGKLKTEKPDPGRADTSSELLLQLALTRRGIAFEMSNLLSFTLHSRWVERLMSARLDAVPASHNLPTMAQLQVADRKFVSDSCRPEPGRDTSYSFWEASRLSV